MADNKTRPICFHDFFQFPEKKGHLLLLVIVRSVLCLAVQELFRCLIKVQPLSWIHVHKSVLVILVFKN